VDVIACGRSATEHPDRAQAGASPEPDFRRGRNGQGNAGRQPERQTYGTAAGDRPPEEGSGGQYNHAGEEFGIVLSGMLELTVEENVFRLRRGDSFYFNLDAHTWFQQPQ
jgi:quercetin dioxygenase-like cupin family protein